MQITNGDEFVLKTAGGTSIGILLSAQARIDAAGGGEISTQVAESAAQAVRKALHDRQTV